MNALIPAAITTSMIITMCIVAGLLKRDPPPAQACTAEIRQGNATHVYAGQVRRDARGAVVCEVQT
jgi:hypothetical protein